MKLTSSNFAAAIGLNPYCSRQKLFRVLTGAANPDPLNDYMAWGLAHECDAVAAIEAHTGFLFRNTGERQKHYTVNGGDFEYGTTPDGDAAVDVEGTVLRIGAETKCPQSIYDEPPIYYVPQLIGQAHIANFHSILFGAWTPEETRIWRYEYDPAHWDWLHPLLEGFMADWANGEQPKRARKPELPEVKIERIL